MTNLMKWVYCGKGKNATFLCLGKRETGRPFLLMKLS